MSAPPPDLDTVDDRKAYEEDLERRRNQRPTNDMELPPEERRAIDAALDLLDESGISLL